MSDMLLVYVVCKDTLEAEKIGKIILEKKLCACVNILDRMLSMYFWPPNSNKIENSSETVLLIKTTKEKFSKINMEVKKIHSYDVPCIFSIKVEAVDETYYKWLKDQIKYAINNKKNK